MAEKGNNRNQKNITNDLSRQWQPLPNRLVAVLRKGGSSLDSDRGDRFLNALLVLVIVIALGTTILLIVLPKENERFSDFFILGANRTSDDYPDEIVAGQQYPMFIGVKNHEKRNVTYLIEIWNMNMTFDRAANTTQIISMDPVERFSFHLDDGETRVIPHTLSVGKTDYNRVAFLLFTDAVPGSVLIGDSDRINASYRNLYLQVSVR